MICWVPEKKFPENFPGPLAPRARPRGDEMLPRATSLRKRVPGRASWYLAPKTRPGPLAGTAGAPDGPQNQRFRIHRRCIVHCRLQRPVGRFEYRRRSVPLSKKFGNLLAKLNIIRRQDVQYDLVIRGGYVPSLPANIEKPRISDGVSKRLYIRY